MDPPSENMDDYNDKSEVTEIADDGNTCNVIQESNSNAVQELDAHCSSSQDIDIELDLEESTTRSECDDDTQGNQDDADEDTASREQPKRALTGDQLWSLTVEYKLQVVDFVHKYGMQPAFLHCQIDEKIIAEWVNNESTLRKMKEKIKPLLKSVCASASAPSTLDKSSELTESEVSTELTPSEDSLQNSLPSVSPNDISAPPPKMIKKCKAYTVEYKLEAIEYLKHHNIPQTAKRFGISTGMVKDWKKLEAKLLAASVCGLKNITRLQPPPKGAKPEPADGISNNADSTPPKISFTSPDRTESDEITQLLENSKKNSSHKGKKVRSYTIDFKLAVVDFAKNHNNCATARHFGIDKKQVRNWSRQEQELRRVENADVRRTLKGKGRKLQYPMVDTMLLSWLVEQEAEGVFVTEKVLKLKASELHRNMDKGDRNFKASTGWLKSFCRRYNVAVPKKGRRPGRPSMNYASFNDPDTESVEVHFGDHESTHEQGTSQS